MKQSTVVERDTEKRTQSRRAKHMSLDTLSFDVLLRIISFLLPPREENGSLSIEWTFSVASNLLSLTCISPASCEAVLTTLKEAKLDKLNIDFFQGRRESHATDDYLLWAASAACQVISRRNPVHLHLLRPEWLKRSHATCCFRYTAWHLLGVGNSHDLQLGEIVGRIRTTKTCLIVAEARLLTQIPLKWLALGSFRGFPQEQVYVILKRLLRGFGDTLTEVWLFGSDDAAYNAVLDTLDHLVALRHMRVATNQIETESRGDPRMFLLRLLSGHHYGKISLKTLIAGEREHLRFGHVEHVEHLSSVGTVVQFTGMSFSHIRSMEGRGIRHIEFRLQQMSFSAIEVLEETALLPNLETVCISCNELQIPMKRNCSTRSNFLDKITSLQASEAVLPSVNEGANYTLKQNDIAYITANCVSIQKFEARYKLADASSLGSLVKGLSCLRDFDIWQSVPEQCMSLPSLTKSEVLASNTIMTDILRSQAPLERLAITRIYVTAPTYVKVLEKFCSSLEHLQMPLTSSRARRDDDALEMKYFHEDAVAVLRGISKYCKRLKLINISCDLVPVESCNSDIGLREEAYEVQKAMRRRGIDTVEIFL
ncbi:hypothetical protein BWQ96_08087 [Gracilariopsis chorda]|uniref:Uncharacterized protein n=1 Tax=Gracilariopsis chorda TaxID=448386 RepID=A0A2V3IJB1_9FLOR|nr:hypothetical protein BWQ96_08087 [Gracilariopsis chorda]|eukprot:PXF42167.1 hypothetical protein BWQ96_08087 [Gracilariopsis chorda]